MTDAQEPPRLRELTSGAPSRLRELFDAAARERPAPADLARLEARLAPWLGDPPALPPPASGSRLSAALKLGLGVLALGGAAVIAVSARDGADGVKPSGKDAVASDASMPLGPAAPSLPTPTLPAPTAPLAPEAPSATPEPAPTASHSAKPRAASPASGLPEDRLLEKARAQLRLDPALSLALTREHQQRFAGGVLTQEREVIAIEALRRLGRDAEADRRKQRFEQRYPGSAHQRKLDTP